LPFSIQKVAILCGAWRFWIILSLQRYWNFDDRSSMKKCLSLPQNLFPRSKYFFSCQFVHKLILGYRCDSFTKFLCDNEWSNLFCLLTLVQKKLRKIVEIRDRYYIEFMKYRTPDGHLKYPYLRMFIYIYIFNFDIVITFFRNIFWSNSLGKIFIYQKIWV
jgi:hypothetical protein